MKAELALILLPPFGAACLAQEDSASRNELAFGLDGIPALSRSDSPSLDAGSGVAFQVNYGRRFLTNNKVALYGEINFLASPLRDVSSSVTTATRDFSSLYWPDRISIMATNSTRRIMWIRRIIWANHFALFFVSPVLPPLERKLFRR